LAAKPCLIVADDHPLFREALKVTLGKAFAGADIVEAGSFDEVVRLLDARESVDLVLLDLKMPRVQGLSGLVYLRAQYCAVPIVVVSASDEAGVIRRALDLGASGFISKSSPVGEMQAAVAAVLGGGVWWPDGLEREAASDGEAAELARRLTTLTPQQMRVLMMLREGLLNKQIAFNLGVSEATIKAHVSAILHKLDVESRTQAVIAASRIDGDPPALAPS
jgi:DNA-binding NarL/FixJ family response regulator